MSENYFKSAKCQEQVTFMLGEYECPDLLSEKSDAYVLDEFIDEYNWDDGLEIPYCILNHPNCELGTALKIFYLGEGSAMLSEGYQNRTLGHWVEFIEYTYKRVSEGNYQSKLIGFNFPLMESAKENIKKAGWPEFFIEDIIV